VNTVCNSDVVVARAMFARVATAHASAVRECELARRQCRLASELRHRTRDLRLARVGPQFRIVGMDDRPPELAVDSIRIGGQVVVSIRGELDVSSSASLDLASLTIDAPIVAIDLSGVGFCDVAGLDALHRFIDRVGDGGIEVHVISTSHAIDRILELLGQVVTTTVPATGGAPPAVR
jgi:anti-anti-sigma factor